MAQITFRNIHKHFGRRLILQGADLSLHTGQCFLLTGPNGAGKSTLQRICAGLEKPDKGSVDTGYGKHSWRQVRRILQNQCVYLHQQPYMFDGTVMENLLPCTGPVSNRLPRPGRRHFPVVNASVWHWRAHR